MPLRVLVIGHQQGADPVGLPERESGAQYVFAYDHEEIRRHLAESDIVFHFGHPRDALSANWEVATRLRWVQIAGVGVDWALFPELVESDVVVTNSRGVVDTTLPEYTLALMLALAKDLPGTIAAQSREEWRHRWLHTLSGGRAVIVGAGSIGRAIGGLLRSVGLRTTIVGQRERSGDIGEGRIRAVADLHELLPDADWLILATPLTESTRGLIGETELALLPPWARLVNMARGKVVEGDALVEALEEGRIAGAALDVFEQEPMPPDHPLWSMPNVIISPHIGGDTVDTPAAFTRSFLDNLERYTTGQPLVGVVDKRLGYPPSDD
jgi:phosphoglycerate dehydrogenase-like enzyme